MVGDLSVQDPSAAFCRLNVPAQTALNTVLAVTAVTYPYQRTMFKLARGVQVLDGDDLFY